MNMYRRLSIFTIIFILCLASCVTSGNSNFPTPTQSITATALLAWSNSSNVGENSSSSSINTQVTTPASISFPQTTESDSMRWRPPLASIPWALNPNDHFYFVRPIAVDEVNWPLENYRYGYIYTDSTAVHTGVDIDAARGSPIYAAGSGRVTWVGYGLLYGENNSSDPYGLAVVVRHNFGFQGRHLLTVYAHLDRIDVVIGQAVDQTTQLGIVGNTGNSTGPHLHFEVRLETGTSFQTRNPELWVVPPEGRGVLVGHIVRNNGIWLTSYPIALVNDEGNLWNAPTYGGQGVFHDDYYQENVVFADLPAGHYTVIIDYQDERYTLPVTINSGVISYFSFRGTDGYSTELPQSEQSHEWLITPVP